MHSPSATAAQAAVETSLWDPGLTEAEFADQAIKRASDALRHLQGLPSLESMPRKEVKTAVKRKVRKMPKTDAQKSAEQRWRQLQEDTKSENERAVESRRAKKAWYEHFSQHSAAEGRRNGFAQGECCP
eukprot:SAG31_NODE_18971_length_616_cov_1.106383_1_plen_129_part_00